MNSLCKHISFSFSKLVLPPTSHKPTPYSGPSYDQLLKDRKTYMPSFYFHYYKEPLLMSQGHMQYLWDHKGNRYLDLIGGICSVSIGHSHPAIAKVVSEQAGKLMHTSPIYMSQYQSEYSKMLAQQCGQEYDSVYLCNSGGQANDFAIYLARLFTQQYKIFNLRNAYHGWVGLSGNLTNVGTWNKPMSGNFQFERLTWPNGYNGAIRDLDTLVKETEQTINASAAGGKVGGFICQPIQGAGGIVPPVEGYLPKVVDIVRKQYGGLIIADEVQTGFGRVGHKYWGHRYQGIKPDIITCAKSIGNGFPMAAVITRKEITDKIKHIYFNTFGGGHLACRIGMEVLKTIKSDKLDDNAEVLGQYFVDEFNNLKKKYPLIGDVRGKGFMLGIEMVKDPNTREPAPTETNQIFEMAKDRGVLLGKGGAFGNVIRLQPPMCITKDDAKYTMQVVEDCLIELGKK